MIALIQRVNQASVNVAGKQIAHIDQGLLAFIGIERNDEIQHADKLVQKLLAYRVFEDEQEKMNLSLTDIQAGLLLVPQFTLAADTKKGLRPNFTPAASPQQAKKLFDYFVAQAEQQHPIVEKGQFGADMQVSLINDGPVTFWLSVPSGNN
jgi:D-tyrosyl-tRNA(Tyr) deacylase